MKNVFVGNSRGVFFCILGFVYFGQTFAARQEMSPTVSTTLFMAPDLQRKPPIAILRENLPRSNGHIPREMEIFAEDPKWTSKVEDFMQDILAGNDDSLSNALKAVRDAAWRAGRTLRTKYAVLLASWEDAELSEGEEDASKVMQAVQEISRHTSDAYLVIVANGLELDRTQQKAIEATLRHKKWRGLTVLKLQEFEGFSSAINRAMGVIPSASIVTILSTSFRLGDEDPGAPTGGGSASTKAGKDRVDSTQIRTSDVFIEYERLRAQVLTAYESIPPDMDTTPDHPGVDERRASTCSSATNDGPPGSSSSNVSSHVPCNKDARICDRGAGAPCLLVTATPLPATIHQKACSSDYVETSRNHHLEGVILRDMFEDDAAGAHNDVIKKRSADSTGETLSARTARAESGAPSPLGPKSPRSQLSDISPLPLLAFDTETFRALGELDESYMFQGGVADWVDRARAWNGDNWNIGERSDCPSIQRYARRCRLGLLQENAGSCAGLSAGAEHVFHFHAQGWSCRFIWPWQSSKFEGSVPHDSARGTNYSDKSADGHFTAMAQDTRIHSHLGVMTRGAHRSASMLGANERTTTELHMVSNEEQEKLVQADVDLFFLPQLLLPHTNFGRANTTDGVPHVIRGIEANACMSFHASWMARGPDPVLVEEAAMRRDKFPVAAVVVLHNQVSYLQETLEDVAGVIEHIVVLVSEKPWRGQAHDISPALKLLDDMCADSGSPVHGKIQVELGSWTSEAEQREHGNALIRANPRNFSRVLVLDTDEFWHPVELTKALILAARQPAVPYVRAEMDTYWASLRSVVSPREPLRPLWLMDPHRCRWYINREIECVVDAGDVVGAGGMDLHRSVGIMHHLSYVRTDESLRTKMGSFSHAGEEQGGWYERSWLGWTVNNSLTDLHPTVPGAFKRVVLQSLFRLTPSLRALHMSARIRRSPDRHNISEQTEKGREDRNAGDDERGLGCEGTPFTDWTDWQRTICFIPDIGTSVHESARNASGAAGNVIYET